MELYAVEEHEEIQSGTTSHLETPAPAIPIPIPGTTEGSRIETVDSAEVEELIHTVSDIDRALKLARDNDRKNQQHRECLIKKLEDIDTFIAEKVNEHTLKSVGDGDGDGVGDVPGHGEAAEISAQHIDGNGDSDDSVVGKSSNEGQANNELSDTNHTRHHLVESVDDTTVFLNAAEILELLREKESLTSLDQRIRDNINETAMEQKQQMAEVDEEVDTRKQHLQRVEEALSRDSQQHNRMKVVVEQRHKTIAFLKGRQCNSCKLRGWT